MVTLPVFFSHASKDRRLSLPEWLVTYQDDTLADDQPF